MILSGKIKLVTIAIKLPTPNQKIKKPTVIISPIKKTPAAISQTIHMKITLLYLKNRHLTLILYNKTQKKESDFKKNVLNYMKIFYEKFYKNIFTKKYFYDIVIKIEK